HVAAEGTAADDEHTLIPDGTAGATTGGVARKGAGAHRRICHARSLVGNCTAVPCNVVREAGAVDARGTGRLDRATRPPASIPHTRAIHDGQIAAADDTAADPGRRIAGEGAIRDGQRSVVANSATFVPVGHVVRDGTLVHRQRPIVEDAA